MTYQSHQSFAVGRDNYQRPSSCWRESSLTRPGGPRKINTGRGGKNVYLQCIVQLEHIQIEMQDDTNATTTLDDDGGRLLLPLEDRNQLVIEDEDQCTSD